MHDQHIEALVRTVTDRVWQLLQKRAGLSCVAFETTESAYPNDLLANLQQHNQLVFYADKDAMVQADLLCVSVLSQQQMLAIANLQGIDVVSSAVVARVLTGKQVIVCRQISLSADLHYGVRQKLQDAQRQLLKYGIVYTNDEVLLKKTLTKLSPKVINNERPISFITVDELDRHVQAGKLVLPTNTRLTPSAQDAARDRQLI
ncbi:hypothetical protein [Loigolactobacillus coryniformis]|nr:hypothetical protein [Loigolactobacillus coryniformis]